MIDKGAGRYYHLTLDRLQLLVTFWLVVNYHELFVFIKPNNWLPGCQIFIDYVYLVSLAEIFILSSLKAVLELCDSVKGVNIISN